MSDTIDLWLDDIRPAPAGFVHVRTVAEAQELLRSGRVRRASLDHDLGACAECLGGRSADEWLQSTDYREMPNCDHFGTGYTLVRWMEETGHWPQEKPTVHSRNPVGRERMQFTIDRKFTPSAESR